MKLTQAFLDSLCGMTVADATAKVKSELKIECAVFPVNTIISSIARDEILLWTNKGKVQEATPGDPTRLKKK